MATHEQWIEHVREAVADKGFHDVCCATRDVLFPAPLRSYSVTVFLAPSGTEDPCVMGSGETMDGTLMDLQADIDTWLAVRGLDAPVPPAAPEPPEPVPPADPPAVDPWDDPPA